MSLGDVFEPNFRRLFEKAPGQYLVLGPDLVIYAVSDDYLHATMTRREAIVGRPLFEVFPDNPNDQDADGVSNIRASLEGVLAQGKPDVIAAQKYDVRGPGGVFEERYWSLINTPVFADDGTIECIINHVVDVTLMTRLQREHAEGDAVTREQQQIIHQLREANEALTRNEAALRDSEGSLRTTQRIARVGLWRHRVGSPALEWSDEIFELFGMEPKGPPPTMDTFLDGLTPESRATVLDVLEADPPPAAFTFTLKVRRPDGTVRDCWTEGRTELDADGRLAIVEGISQDVTERESAAAQLQQAQKMEAVGQLTGGLAHDFNNLLAIIIGNLDLIADELEPGVSVKDFADAALQAALRGSELTRQLLAFSRRQPLDPKVINLNKLVAEIDPLWRRTLGERVAVRLALTDDLWHAKVDRSQLESSLLNLVINARDAMPEGGVLTIETSNVSLDGMEPDLVPGDYAEIAVSDTGLGMTPEVLSQVFEPFFTTKDVGQGSGLGLSMVYGFTKQSGGQLKIYSEVGHGTTVRLYLPRARGALAGDSVRTLRQPAMGNGERVLVVEDNAEVRHVAVRQLTDLGYTVIEAENGAEALKALDADPRIDLVFSDIILSGGMTGIEIVEAARRNRPSLRALFTTGFARAATVGGSHVSGEDVLITKPYRRADLAAKVREVLNK